MKVRADLLLASIALCVVACEGRPKPEEKPATNQAPTVENADDSTEVVEDEPKTSRRPELKRWRALLDELPRAELRTGGLHIDFGTAESSKYIRGGWENRWGSYVDSDEGPTATKLDGSSGPIDFVLRKADKSPGEVVVRMRAACKDRMVKFQMDGKDLGDEMELPTEWTTLRVPIEGKLDAGAHRLTIRPNKSCKKKPRAHVDWVWLAETAGAEPPEIVDRAKPLTIGDGLRRALNAPTARTYSFYLHIPEKAELVFDHASSVEGTEFAVQIATDGEEPQEVFKEKATSQWTEGSVDLKPWATKAVRIDLTTSGEAGDTGWGEVDIMIPELPKERDIEDPDAKPKNLVYILIDTQRADAFEPIGGEGSPVKTPTFDALAKDGVAFTQAYNQENWTKPSVATILSGLYPVSHDTSGEEETVPEAVEMLAEILQKQGMSTGAFIANGYISRDFGFNQGWDYYTNFLREKKNHTAKSVYREAMQWVEENHKKPFFLYVQTIDPHVAWSVPKKYTDLYYEGEYKGQIGPSMSGREQADLSGSDTLTDDDIKWIHALYNGEVTYQDEYMGGLMKKLEELGVMDDTLIVISTDHGEELQEHGQMGHRHTLYNELIRSPLVMRYPKRLPPNTQIDDIVELVDMAPTILDVMGFDPSKDHEGLSLVPLIEGRPFQRPRYTIAEYEYNARYGPLDITEDERGMHERSVIVGRWKMWTTHREHRMLFDLKDDPEEQNNMLGKAPIALRLTDIYLAEGLANPNKKVRLLNRLSKKRFKAGTVKIEGELRKQLEALGYFGDK